MSDDLSQAIKDAADAIERELGTPEPDPSQGEPLGGCGPMVHQLVYSMMLWESGHAQAASAVEALLTELIDFNELRVCDAAEVSAMLPREVGRRSERAERLLASLNKIYNDQHALTLGGVAASGKREARAYLDGLDSLPSYVTARTLLLTMGGHAMPTDSRIVGVLQARGVVEDAKANPDEIAGRLERAVRAADGARIYALLEKAAGQAPSKSSGRRRARSGA